MDKNRKETLKVRLVSIGFVVLALAVFKPFGLAVWQWEAYVHVFAFGLLGIGSCLLTECILKYLLRLPHTIDEGVDYIIRRNLWFQLINTPLVSLAICLYRHIVLSSRIEDNLLSWGNFLETLLIIAFCSFAIGLFWRFKYRSKYLAAELEETRQMNEQLQRLHQQLLADATPQPSAPADPDASPRTAVPDTITLTGTTSDTLTLPVSHLLFIESVGNYVKVCHLCDGVVRSDMLRATSHQMEEALSAYPLVVRCHRAFLVNLAQVERIVSQSGNMQLLLRHCDQYLPVSRSNVPQVKQAFSSTK